MDDELPLRADFLVHQEVLHVGALVPCCVVKGWGGDGWVRGMEWFGQLHPYDGIETARQSVQGRATDLPESWMTSPTSSSLVMAPLHEKFFLNACPLSFDCGIHV